MYGLTVSQSLLFQVCSLTNMTEEFIQKFLSQSLLFQVCSLTRPLASLAAEAVSQSLLFQVCSLTRFPQHGVGLRAESQSLLFQVCSLTVHRRQYGQVHCLNPFFFRSAV